MPLHNDDMAAIFSEIADLLEIQGARSPPVTDATRSSLRAGRQREDVAGLSLRLEERPRSARLG